MRLSTHDEDFFPSLFFLTENQHVLVAGNADASLKSHVMVAGKVYLPPLVVLTAFLAKGSVILFSDCHGNVLKDDCEITAKTTVCLFLSLKSM